MKHKFLYARLIFLGTLNIFLGGCRDSAVSAPHQRPPVPVKSVIATSQEVPLYLEALGHVRASEEVQVVPQVSGEIMAIHFTQGAIVQKGDLLFSLDARLYEAAVEKAEADLAKASSQLKVDEAQYERSKALVPESYISSQEFELQAAHVEQGRANVRLAQSQLSAALVNLEHCSLKAPIAGMTGKYEIDVGNVVSVGSGRPLVSLKKLDPIYVDFSISENQFPLLKQHFDMQEGVPVSVQSLSNPSCSLEGRLRFIQNYIDKATGNLPLRAEVSNPQHELWPGEAVSVKILLRTLKEAVLVPESCVKLGQQGHYLFVIKEDHTVELRGVQKGQRHGDFIVILQGVVAGEQVVKSGQMMLAPGAPVVILPNH
ncbi:MAG: efflux RND transporter periplasmic adaptor subunit [Puniceicoccales bacterium]|jgi:multidrug efflux system membrane fusion protein|nr:efflux RND transporter periplasmic adaptor subunit [Puniceicoccales bacterium]